MLKEIKFHEAFLPDTHKGAVKIKHVEIGGNLWMVEEMDMNHPVFKDMRQHFTNIVDDKYTTLLARKIEPGVFEVASFNFEHDVDFITNHKVVGNYGMIDLKTGNHITSESLQFSGIDWSNLASLHGVSDNVAQIKEKFKNALLSDEQYIITVNEIRKSEQSEDGGWKWHKWGEYIGVQNPKCEYIADEPEIESVFCFHIHKVELKPALIPTSKPRIK